MSDLHPHWHATGNQSKATPPSKSSSTVRVPVSATGQAHTQSVSRAPAAIVGILVTVTVGLSAFQGWTMFLGQAAQSSSSSSASSQASNSMEVHITPEGFLPPEINATAGMKITIINNDSIPHIIESKTLRDGSGRVLYSPALFPEQAYEFDIYADEVSGQHRLSSTTTASLGVTITLTAPNSSSSGLPFGDLNDVPLPTGGNGQVASSAKSNAKSSSKSSIKNGGLPKVPSATTVTTSSATAAATSSAPLASPTSSGTGASASGSGKAIASATSESSTTIAAPSAEVGSTITDTTVDDAAAAAASAAAEKAQAEANALAAAAAHAAAQEEANAQHSSSVAAAALHAGADLHPPKNANTGPEIWLALAGGLAGVVTVSKKHLKAFTLN